MEAQAKHDTVLDIGAEHLGRIYAEALLAAAGQGGVSDLVVEQLRQVVHEVVVPHPALGAALASPRIDAAEKGRVLDRLFAQRIDPMLLRFLKVLAQRGRLGFLSAISDAAKELRDQQLQRTTAEVCTAVPLTDDLRSTITERLSQHLGKGVILREKVDPSLLGGLVVRVGDTVYDSSVSGQLSMMAKRTQSVFARRLMERADRFSAPTSS